MIFSKLGQAIQAFFNGIANALIARDPISVMQLEIDRQAERLKTGREGVEQYRGLVERVARQVAMGSANVNRLTAQIKSHLKAGNEAMAAQLAVQLKAARDELTQNTEQLTMHEEAYKNHLIKLQEGNKNMGKLREKAQKYSAELKMSAAEAEIARVAESLGQTLSGNLTTDLGQIESIIQGQIDANRGRARVAADMSSQGVEEIKATQRAEQVEAMEILDQFKVEMGLKSPETTPVSESTTKDLGPAQTN